MKTKPHWAEFQDVRIGAAFRFSGSYWIKVSSRTARIQPEDRLFYFSKKDRCGL